MMNLLIIGNPENRRVTLFCEAAASVPGTSVTIWPYESLLKGDTVPPIRPGTVIKIDSPGENNLVRQLLIAKGLNDISPDHLAEHGIIANTGAWYKGYGSLLQQIETVLPPARYTYMNAAHDIQLMFNKPDCQRHLQQHGISVPQMLPAVSGYNQLLQVMQQQRCMQVFIKPSHTSSASGVIAFRSNGSRVQAITSAEMNYSKGFLQLFNSLKVRTYTQENDIAILINRILAEGAQVEAWLPKATLQQRYFDVRVLVIAGRARHTVIRTSKQVITNLHLGNKRGDTELFTETYGYGDFLQIKLLAEQAAACFKDALYMGVDILRTPNGKLYVLEVNAFGDLLPGLLDENEDCYQAEITAIMQR